MKHYLYLLLLLASPFLGTSQTKFQFQNTNLSTQERVENLLSEMTLQEKIDQCNGWELDRLMDIASDALVLPPDDTPVRQAINDLERE